MKPFLKKITGFFLLLIGAMPFLFTLFFLVKQQIIHHEMKEKLEREFLHTITVPKDKVNWVKYSKEIRIDSKLFDVNSFSEKNGIYFFTGLFDTEETALNDLLEKETEDGDQNELAQLFQLLQSPCTNLSFNYFLVTGQDKTTCFPILLHISSPFVNIPTPPPQVSAQSFQKFFI